jgi:hypothetical protein
MPGLVPGIHALGHCIVFKAWMAGTSPAMTDDCCLKSEFGIRDWGPGSRRTKVPISAGSN